MVSMRKIRVGNVNDIPEGKMISFRYEDHDILIANINNRFYAVSNICTHAGANLHEGRLDGNRVICPWHNAVWDLTTGNLVKFPVQLKELKKYDVEIIDDNLYITI